MSYKDYWKVKGGNKSLTASGPAHLYMGLVRCFPFLNKKYSVLLSLPQGAKVLDVGVGTGSFLRVIHRMRPDLELYGVDVSDEGFAYMDFPAETKIASGESLPFTDDFFDFVSCQHVLEHVSDAQPFVAELVRVSKGYVLLVTPNHKTLWLWDRHNFWTDPTHVRPYSASALAFLGKQAGLEKVYCQHERYVHVPWLVLFFACPFFVLRGWGAFLGRLADMVIKRGAVYIGRVV